MNPLLAFQFLLLAATGNFTERGTAAADPSTTEAGDIYLNTPTGKVRIHSKTTWIDLN